MVDYSKRTMEDLPLAKRPRIEASVLSSAEAELYDRQIRLWGVEAQKRLNSARILIIGMNGLGAEVAKNIILGGVKSVTLMDPALVTELDASSQFLVAREAVGLNRSEASLAAAQKLNPNVLVSALKKSPTDYPNEFYAQFDVIVAVECTKKENIRLSELAHGSGAAFFTGDVLGFFGYMTVELGGSEGGVFHYTKKRTIPKTATSPETSQEVEGETTFISYSAIVNQDKDDNPLWAGKRTHPTLFAFYVLLDFFEQYKRHPLPDKLEEDLKELLCLRDEFCKKQGVSTERVPDELFEFVFGQVGPVCAVTGGVLAQEIVKAISHRDEPLNNLFLYNPMVGTGIVERVQ